ncbi:GDSL-type esterase/lipase family protein [Aeoliella sp. ICT_H6.2]|uniref:GDSL-type esterase/lipase family protein n=1 Tax=Aeoliella straminimaris TaxID=2954799 RepID=A0A9X2F980_9BACT|nr:GDSL-type esterase/lipase family protein [Aeoliella straminimaris]MCO6043927.1 GDSL-type esterase/lipase family protein [Aeoliella straminimaris]
MTPKRIAFFGSSSIYGTADDEAGGFVNRFRLWYESIDNRHRVYNLGIWGEQTRSLIDRIAPEAARRRPHLIMVYPGFNDCRRQGFAEAPNAVPLPRFREAMQELISNAQAITETVVMTGYPFDESRTSPYLDTDSHYLLRDAEDYSSALVAVARRCQAGVLDLFTQLQCVDMNSLLAPDGLHCNAQGHEKLCVLTKDYFRAAYGLKAF